MAFSEADAAEIERLYADRRIPVAEIARRFGRSGSSISALARRRGWPMRSGRLGSTLPSAPSAAETLEARLYRTATGQLDMMEIGMANGTISPADFERMAKSVGTIVGALGKVAAVKNAQDAERRPGAGDERAASDTDRKRREIAERLERLAAQRLAQRGSGEPR